MAGHILKIVLLALLLYGNFATLSSATTNVSLGICIGQKVELRKHDGGYTTYPLQEHIYSFVCGLYWKKCTYTTNRYSPEPELQHVNQEVAIPNEEEICCKEFSGIPPNCTPICEPQCENGGECTLPGECLCREGWVGAYCEKALCSPPCKNGGQCMAPDVCKCLPTWTGLHCETVMVPVVLSSERISATSLRVELEQVTVNQTIGAVNAYKVVIKEMQTGECSSTVTRVLDNIVNLEVIVDKLDPQKMYCVYVAAKTVAMVSEFSEPMDVPLYINTPLELTLQVNRPTHSYNCQGWTQVIMKEITDGINKVGEFQMTSDNFQPEYITNTEWNCSLVDMVNVPVAVYFRFTLISTDIINSTELAALLKYWVRQQPVRLRGYNITLESAQCINDHYIGPNTVICTNTPYGDPPPKPKLLESIVVTVVVPSGILIGILIVVVVRCVIKKKKKNTVLDTKPAKK